MRNPCSVSRDGAPDRKDVSLCDDLKSDKSDKSDKPDKSDKSDEPDKPDKP